MLRAGEGCCEPLTWHLRQTDDSLASARRNVDAWRQEIAKGLDAIVITASGGGTTIKDYGHMLREDPIYAEDAARISSLAMDVTGLLAEYELRFDGATPRPEYAWHAPC